MNFLFTEFFWGSLLILSGLSLILKVLLGIDIPIFRLIIAGLLIYGGLSLIVGPGFKFSKKQTIIFSKTSLKPETLKSLTSVFSKTSLDLSDLKVRKPQTVKTDTMFGQTTIKLNRSVPTEVVVNASFANATLPNNNSISFGSSRYNTSPDSSESPHLILEATVVFGNLEIIEV